MSPASGSGDPRAAAGTAVDRASDVSSLATQRAGDVAGTAADEARRVGSEIAGQARGLLGEARDKAWEQGEAQTGQLARAAGDLAGEARALLDGRPEDAPTLAGPAGDLVDRIDGLTRRLQERGLQGSVTDLQRYARRRPGRFLVGAGALGFVAGRLLRAEHDRGPDAGDGASGGYTGVPRVAPPPVPVSQGWPSSGYEPALPAVPAPAAGYGEYPETGYDPAFEDTAFQAAPLEDPAYEETVQLPGPGLSGPGLSGPGRTAAGLPGALPGAGTPPPPPPLPPNRRREGGR